MEDEKGQTTSTHESLKMHTKILVRKYVGKRTLENLQAGSGIKTYLEDTWHKEVDSTGTAWEQLVVSCEHAMNLQAAYEARNFSTNFTRQILLCEVSFAEHTLH